MIATARFSYFRHLVALCLVLTPTGVFANGRPPNTTGIAVAADDSNWLLAGVTFGATLSTDGGKSWHWICEEVLGGPIATDAVVAITAHKRLWVGNVLGLFASDDSGCSWQSMGTFSSKHMEVRHLGRHPHAPEHLLVVANDVASGRGRIFETRDNGAHFRELGALESGLYAYSADFAPTRPERVVVAVSNNRAEHSFLLAVSENGGKSFQLQEVIGAPAASAMPRVAISPQEANRLVVGAQDLKTGGTTLLLTEDLGKSWRKVGASSDLLRDLSWAEDGKSAYAGTESRVLISTDAGQAFTPLATPKFNGCATFAHGRLYLCGSSRSGDGFSVGTSPASGTPVTTLGTMEAIVGPNHCARTKQTFKRCMPLWPDEAESIRAVPVPPHAEEQADAHDREEAERQEGERRRIAEAASRQAEPAAKVSATGCHCNTLIALSPYSALVLLGVALRRRRILP